MLYELFIADRIICCLICLGELVNPCQIKTGGEKMKTEISSEAKGLRVNAGKW